MVTDSRHSSTDGYVCKGRSGGVTDTRGLARGDELINVGRLRGEQARMSTWASCGSNGKVRGEIKEESLREGRRGEKGV